MTAVAAPAGGETAPTGTEGSAGAVRRVAGLFRPYRARLGVVAVLVLVGAGLGVTNPLLVRAVFDDALFGRDGPRTGLLAVLVGLMVLTAALSAAAEVSETWLTNTVGQRVMRDLRDRLYGHLEDMPLRFFTTTRTGEIQSRLANDVGGLQDVITDTASSVLGNVVVVVSTVIAMAVLSWPLTVLSLALLPLFAVTTRRVGQRRRAARRQTQQSLAQLSARVEETLSVSGILLAKIFGRQRDEVTAFGGDSSRLADRQVRQVMVGTRFFAFVQLFFAVTPALTYLAAGLTLRTSLGVSAGTLVAVTALQNRLFQPIQQLLRTVTDVSSSLALFGRIFEYLDLEPEIVDAPDALALPPAEVRGRVSLERVWFSYTPQVRYQGEPRWALQDLTLDVPAGTMLAVVGPSGAGKTSIAYLVPRLYDATRGTVRLDGFDVRSLAASTLSGSIAMVTQESYLFHATIADNLRYARPGASLEELEAAARAANIHQRILEFEDGYDTVVGERGYRLSGGERQRLAIARVILADPRVLVLDEATSALDTVSERLVQAALEPLMRGRTTIAIAHRLSTIRRADAIAVLDRGRLAELGSHDELLARGGLYRELYRQQFGDGDLESHCADGVVLSDGRILRAMPAEADVAPAAGR